MSFELFPVPTEISIDKVSLVGEDGGGFVDYLNSPNNVYILGRSLGKYPYKYIFRCVDGSTIQVKDQSASCAGFRIEFNPNKAILQEIGKFVSRLKYVRITRVDYAIDYYNEDLSRFTWIDLEGRKRVWYADGSGRIETLYIGAPNADKRFRIYNKALEQGVEDSVGAWWRVEAQVRFSDGHTKDGKWWNIDNPFDIYPMLYERPLDGKMMSARDKGVLYWLRNEPSAWGELSKYERKKYKEMLIEHGVPLNPSPDIVFHKEKDRLARQLDDLIVNSVVGIADKLV